MKCILFGVLVASLIVARLDSQRTAPVLVSGDPQAITVVQSSLAVLSGSSSWEKIKAVHLIGTITNPGNTEVSVTSFDPLSGS
jgi:hypothetical protein